MSASRTPSLASSAVQLASKPSPTAALKRATTMPMRNPAPPAPASTSSMESYLVVTFVRLKIAGDLQIESCHAGHSTRLRHQPHFHDLQIAQYLRADTVVAQRVLLRRRNRARQLQIGR